MERSIPSSSLLQLTPQVSKEQLGVYMERNIPWRQVFIERFKLQQNWLKGNCFVRTFEGHTQVGEDLILSLFIFFFSSFYNCSK